MDVTTKTCPWCDMQPKPELGIEGRYDSKRLVLRLRCPQCNVSKGVALSDDEDREVSNRALSHHITSDHQLHLYQMRAAAEIVGERVAAIWNDRKGQ